MYNIHNEDTNILLLISNSIDNKYLHRFFLFQITGMCSISNTVKDISYLMLMSILQKRFAQIKSVSTDSTRFNINPVETGDCHDYVTSL